LGKPENDPAKSGDAKDPPNWGGAKARLKSGEPKVPSKSADAKYEPTEPERSVLSKQQSRRSAENPAPLLKVVSIAGKSTSLSLDHVDHAVGFELLQEALGTADPVFAQGLINQLAKLSSSDGLVSGHDLNFIVSIIKALKPTDELEAMLAAQMAGIHLATMTFAGRLAHHADTISLQDSAERALNKLTRTFVMQMEALKRYRTGGEQKVTVQHVSVSDGGQAIVGNVTHAARAAVPQQPADQTLALTDARQVPMPIIKNSERVRAPVRRRQEDDGQSSA
jgi:hypothetical protein